ncbi:MAG: histidine kinase, partial [Flavobacteriaceae bacterium]|nr:histidine kinase [Flavobacteriaceae bacterium]
MLIQESHRFHFWHEDIGLTQILLLSNVMFIGIIGLVYWYEKRTIHRYEHQIAELEEKSRRVFMNPHFFFNALNGIQGLYVSGGLQVTNSYITKLSKLLRFTMELNVNNYISLQEEVDYISNYTDLMQLRTDNKFQFC